MDDVDFTDDEIFSELEMLGYKNIPPERFSQFKTELFHLIRQERSQNSSSSSRSDTSLVYSDNRRQNSPADDTSDTIRTVSSQLSEPNKENVSKESHDEIFARRAASALDFSRPAPKLSAAAASKHPLQPFLKRKVLRKVDGQVSISESFTESEASDELSSLQEQLQNAVLDEVRRPRPKSAPPSAVSRSHNFVVRFSADPQRLHSTCREPSHYNLPEDYQGPKSLIKSTMCEPHVLNVKKSDPVSRYQVYQRAWNACRAPGEKAHKQLRWGVREKMLYHDQVVEKTQRSYRPNGYVIPSDKKRKALRWQIRVDLAQGVKPPSAFD